MRTRAFKVPPKEVHTYLMSLLKFILTEFFLVMIELKIIMLKMGFILTFCMYLINN